MSDNDLQGIWDAIAAPLDPRDIKTREIKGVIIRYIDRTTVEERLNSVCPGDWHMMVTPILVPNDFTGKWVVKVSLTICGVTREEFGMNDNETAFDPPKAAVSDGFKRCASLYGLGRELYHDPAKQGPKDAYSKPKPVVKNLSSDDTALPFAPDKVLSTFEARDWTAFWPFMAKHVGKKPSELHAYLHEITGVESLKECGLTFGELMSAIDN